MAKLSFKAENKAADNNSFPKIRLEDGETAKIVCFEDPDVAYVHNLRAPKIVNGVAQKETLRNKDGSTREDYTYDFIGNPICLGDESVLADRGVDPKNCPACKMASETDMVAPPKRRFAMHVFQYNTNGTAKVAKPFQGTVKVWAFTDQIFNQLIDIAEDTEQLGGLAHVDLVLGPCESKQYQKYKIIPSIKPAEYKSSPQTQAAFEEATAENKAADISKFLGKTQKRDWMEDDLEKVRARWRQAKGQANEVANDGLAAMETTSLSAGLEGLLDTKPAEKQEATDFNAVLTPAAPADSDNNGSGDAAGWDDIMKGL